jgi:DNA-binding response OmpR family regulator
MHSVLLIDDNSDFRLIFQRKFSDLGYQVFVAADGIRGLQVVMEQAVDVVLLDWNMPHRNGLETLTLIRTVKADLPVVIITALIDDTEVLEARELGVSDILYKPMGIKALGHAVRRVLGQTKS